MIVIESREDGRELDGAVVRDSTFVFCCASFLIDTAAIRNEANLLKIKERDQF